MPPKSAKKKTLGKKRLHKEMIAKKAKPKPYVEDFLNYIQTSHQMTNEFKLYVKENFDAKMIESKEEKKKS
jgi:hypothetical protein